ncbi:HEAT repeat domain-containing protein [Zunongwangia endophytica]|uniref:HEAT repeat domain-containing protein n=1 Tax=Zunongwangia endophytica TaxID=1808945 RepID=A0ABV8HGA3_9FLAO|nr:DNA alkylation repair protein [Zunongwangia endophytica]MDN3596845.1 DNA alkylation repair protein [Zunongwangia endophytica]
MKEILAHIKTIEHGFKHIIEAGNSILNDKSQHHLELAQEFLTDESYQVRMLGTYMLGELSTDHPQALEILRTTVAQDQNWRVQEMLAKAFDHFCARLGYEKSLPTIKEWLSQPNPNTKRAVIEGLRIWTGRPYFKENPQVAIALISEHRENENKYLRNSIGNSLRDIRKKHQEVVDREISHWVNDPRFGDLKKLIQK